MISNHVMISLPILFYLSIITRGNSALQFRQLYVKRKDFMLFLHNTSHPKENLMCLCIWSKKQMALLLHRNSSWIKLGNSDMGLHFFQHKRLFNSRKPSGNSSDCALPTKLLTMIWHKSKQRYYRDDYRKFSCHHIKASLVQNVLKNGKISHAIQNNSQWFLLIDTGRFIYAKTRLPDENRNTLTECRAQSPCCTEDGKIVPASAEKKCGSSSDECTLTSRCNGLTAECPAPKLKDHTVCMGSKICMAGICNTSICLKYGMQECQCRKDCDICCRNLDEFCLPLTMYGVSYYFRQLGSFCDNYAGYCNNFGLCSYFKHSFADSEQLGQEIILWLRLNWYSIIIILLPFVSAIFLLLLPENNIKIHREFYGEVDVMYKKLRNHPKVQLSARYMTDSVIQFSRLAVLFPTISFRLIGECIQQLGKEEFIIKMFLANGAPMRIVYNHSIKLPSRSKSINIDSNLEINTSAPSLNVSSKQKVENSSRIKQ